MAKSRIHLAAHARTLAVAMLRDTITAVLQTPAVDRVVLVCDELEDAHLVQRHRVQALVDRNRLGLNPAITLGVALVRSHSPGCDVAVLPGDLPALSSTELHLALTIARRYPRTFVADANGSGTTMLTARWGHTLNPSYGPQSRVRHAATGAVELAGVAIESLRQDVDDLESLHTVAERVGRSTGRILAALSRESVANDVTQSR